MNQALFAPEDELYQKLYLASDQRSIKRRPKAIANASQSGGPAKEKTYLPGQPHVGLNDPNIGSYLESELVTRDLNKLAPHLWLVAKQDSSHVSSLTHQIVRGRKIVVTEQPGLHLVWIYDRVYIKPIPKYLVSHAFWKFYFISKHSPIPEPVRQDITRAALGFLRTYRYLIQHKSDFILATDDKVRLLPKGIRHSEFIRFITVFGKMMDSDVSPRYEFGELRLTRLNFWSKIFLHRYTYQKVHGQYGAYFAQFYGPIFFVFGVFSVALNAMQVGLSIQPFVTVGPSWTVFAEASRWFAIWILFIVALIVMFLIITLAFLSGRETVFAVKERILKRTSTTAEDAEARMPVASGLLVGALWKRWAEVNGGYRTLIYEIPRRGIRSHELALECGVQFFIWCNLNYGYKKSGYQPPFRTGHYAGKGRVGEWILQQTKDNPSRMRAALFTTGPYIDMAIARHTAMMPTMEANDTGDDAITWRVPLGEGAIPLVALSDCGPYVQWLVDHRDEDRVDGLDLEVAVAHTGYDELAATFQKVTGYAARFLDVSSEEYWRSGPMARGRQSPAGYNADPEDVATMSVQENFTGFGNLWKNSGGNSGVVRTDYTFLDEVFPGSIRSAEEWFRMEDERSRSAGEGSLLERVIKVTKGQDHTIVNIAEDGRKGKL